jgi:hypothetical protein
MVLQSSGPIKFSEIRAEFNSSGTNNLIKFSNYYANATTNYTAGINGIPNIGSSINLSYFYGKSSLPTITVNNIVRAWNTQNSVITYTFDDTTNNNSITFTKNTYCQILLVGGGSGFFMPEHQVSNGPGGGGGGIYYDPNFKFLIGTYNIIIGQPGAVEATTYSGANGTDTYITSNNSLYGTYKGLGGTYNNNYNNSYDGGGPTYTYIASIDANSVKTINTYIYNGQPEYYLANASGGYQAGTYAGAGSGAGGSAHSFDNPDRSGGPGYTSSITGLSITYAGGGAGSDPINTAYSPGNGSTNYGGGATDVPRQNAIKGCAIIRFLNY